MEPEIPGPLEAWTEEEAVGPEMDIEAYVEGIEYPASVEVVASAAHSRGAPQELVDIIRSANKESFTSTEDVLTSL